MKKRKLKRLKQQVERLDVRLVMLRSAVGAQYDRLDGIGRVVARLADRLDRPEVDD